MSLEPTRWGAPSDYRIVFITFHCSATPDMGERRVARNSVAVKESLETRGRMQREASCLLVVIVQLGTPGAILAEAGMSFWD
jgi:hypothetical protein